jgi:hypothetical protein
MRSALVYARQKAAFAQAAASPTPIRAGIRAGQPAEGPALGPVKARKAAREAEHVTLTAEIESLATPEDVERAMKVEEAKVTQRERQDAAIEADKAARGRARAGLRPTVAEPEPIIEFGVTANGDHKVGSGRRAPTPEQIAAGAVENAS